MSKHTQGPWEFLEEKEYNNVPFISIRKKGFILIDDPDADEKNSIAGIWSTKPIDFANARLIAAAPELLEALEFFLSLPAVIATHEGSGWSAENVKKIEAARAAIAKVKGE